MPAKKTCREDQFLNPETNRCKNIPKKVAAKKVAAKKVVAKKVVAKKVAAKKVVSKTPSAPKPASKPSSSKTKKILDDVDSMCGLCNTETISLIDMKPNDRKKTIDAVKNSQDMKQLETVCQGGLDEEYIMDTLVNDDISHIMLLKVKNLVVSYAFLTEKKTKDKVDYMYINIMCARKYSSTGRYMLLAAENFTLRRGFSLTSLNSVSTAIGFYSKMGYKTIPVGKACESSKLPDLTDVAKEAKKYVESSKLLKDVRSKDISDDDDEYFTNIAFILKWMGFGLKELYVLIESKSSPMKKWEKTFEKIILNDFFDRERLLSMTKCLR